MLLLSQVRRYDEDSCICRTDRTANSEAADLLRSRDISVKQRRRNPADAHIIKSITGVVFWQQRGDIDIKSKQIADGIVVFRPIKTVQSIGASRVRLGCSRAIQRSLQV